MDNRQSCNLVSSIQNLASSIQQTTTTDYFIGMPGCKITDPRFDETHSLIKAGIYIQNFDALRVASEP